MAHEGVIVYPMTVESLTNPNFPLPLRGEIFNKGRRIRLLAPFIYEDKEKGLIISIPEGFESDYNSVPWGLWNLLPPWEYPEAAVVHDWLYKHPQGFYKGPGSDELFFSRRECDDIHRRILHLLGAPWAKRQAMWLGIRAGGAHSWNRYRNSLFITDTGKHEPTESKNLPPVEPKNAEPPRLP